MTAASSNPRPGVPLGSAATRPPGRVTSRQSSIGSWFVVAAIVACVLEGAVRKWIFPDSTIAKYVAYFSKDAILLACLFLPPEGNHAAAARLRRFVLPGVFLVGLGGLLGSFQGFSLVGAALTIRSTMVLPIAAVFIIPRLTSQVLPRAVWTVLLLTAVNAPLGALQFYSPATSAINRYDREGDYGVATATYSDRVRATGTFSYITGYATFAELAIVIGLVVLALGRTPRTTLMGYIGVLGGVVCAGATVSRGTAVITAATLLAWGALSGVRRQALGAFVAVTAVVAAILAGLGLLSGATEIVSSAARRGAVVNDSASDRAMLPFIELVQAMTRAPLGQGFGTEQVAGNLYSHGVATFTSFESDFPRIVMETGVIGFVGVALCYLGAIYEVFSLRRESRAPAAKSAYLAVGLGLGAWLLGVVFNHVASFLFWTLVIVMLASSDPDAEPGNALARGGKQMP